MRKVTNINALWAFRKTDTLPSSFDRTWDIISLPHTWNAIDGMDGGNDYWRGKATYAKVLTIEDLPSSCENYVEIKGAGYSADVFFNGEKLFHHEGGFSTFRVHLPIFPSQASHDTELAPLILGCEIKGVHIHVIDEAVEEITFFSQLCALPGVIAP